LRGMMCVNRSPQFGCGGRRGDLREDVLGQR
jgi:hypothetical protein